MLMNDDGLIVLPDEPVYSAAQVRELLALERAMAYKEQMERDCIAVCWGCRKGREYHGDTHIWNTGAWGKNPIEQRMRCRAANIRAEYALAQPPASAPAATEGATR